MEMTKKKALLLKAKSLEPKLKSLEAKYQEMRGGCRLWISFLD